ncbi:hypothetical protein QYE77_08435 [Thermanaerothrix sp. 4228-RoL]|uniref:Uncharacterized protein n=1 Tax=Thermanaerothrix solaris TaxID=3058434 RepID=A0ABU3NQ15_9CHLR|nr:hypothetical protein [Thermanaerothrix sp. 4228-RoL]MDT8898293.1 hypothetical protein [Thermanaerothrix sp. 4228-RoL]
MEALIRIGMAFLPLILAAAGCGALAARRVSVWLVARNRGKGIMV